MTVRGQLFPVSSPEEFTADNTDDNIDNNQQQRQNPYVMINLDSCVNDSYNKS